MNLGLGTAKKNEQAARNEPEMLETLRANCDTLHTIASQLHEACDTLLRSRRANSNVPASELVSAFHTLPLVSNCLFSTIIGPANIQPLAEATRNLQRERNSQSSEPAASQEIGLRGKAALPLIRNLRTCFPHVAMVTKLLRAELSALSPSIGIISYREQLLSPEPPPPLVVRQMERARAAFAELSQHLGNRYPLERLTPKELTRVLVETKGFAEASQRDQLSKVSHFLNEASRAAGRDEGLARRIHHHFAPPTEEHRTALPKEVNVISVADLILNHSSLRRQNFVINPDENAHVSILQLEQAKWTLGFELAVLEQVSRPRLRALSDNLAPLVHELRKVSEWIRTAIPSPIELRRVTYQHPSFEAFLPVCSEFKSLQGNLENMENTLLSTHANVSSLYKSLVPLLRAVERFGDLRNTFSQQLACFCTEASKYRLS
jgi:hypothetical protein